MAPCHTISQQTPIRADVAALIERRQPSRLSSDAEVEEFDVVWPVQKTQLNVQQTLVNMFLDGLLILVLKFRLPDQSHCLRFGDGSSSTEVEFARGFRTRAPPMRGASGIVRAVPQSPLSTARRFAEPPMILSRERE